MSHYRIVLNIMMVNVGAFSVKTDVIGVTINPGQPIDIVLRFSPQRFNFVRTKPIHPYQIEDEANNTLKLN